MSYLSTLPALGLVACSNAVPAGAMLDWKDQAVNASPLVRQIAASNTFYFCDRHPEPERYDAICEACDVDLFVDKDLPVTADPDQAAPIVGLKVFATHFYHEYKPWGDDPKPRISVSGERASQTFRTKEVSAAAARDFFDQGNAWCRGRRDGEFHVLKDEIETYFSGEGS